MKITATLPDHGVIVEAVLEGFVLAAMEMIAARAVPPSPLDTPVRYVEEVGEEWLLPNQVLQRGMGDCEDLCIWYAAGMRVTGQDAGAACVLVMTGKKKIHCLVVLSDGRTVDPSLILKTRQQGAPWQQGAPFAVAGDVRVTDHRGQPNPDAKRTNAPPAAAYEGTKNTPQNDPLYAITEYMKKNPGYRNRDASGDKSGVTFTEQWQQDHGGSVSDKLWERRAQRPDFIAAMQGIANAQAVGDTISANFGRGVRSTTPGENMVQLDDGYGGLFWSRQGINDPLAEMPQTSQSPWGGAYGSDYGYGGDFGYPFGGYGYGGGYAGGGYGGSPWEDSPLLTYFDLYGGFEDGMLDMPSADEHWPYGGTEQEAGMELDPSTWEEV